jgi:hypothetical protein
MNRVTQGTSDYSQRREELEEGARDKTNPDIVHEEERMS